MSTIGKVQISLEAQYAQFSKGVQQAGKDLNSLANNVEHLKKAGAGSDVFDKLREGLGRRSGLGEAAELLRGGGPIGGLTGAADAIKGMAEGAAKLKAEFDSGKLSAGELTEKLIEGVPVVGQFWQAGKAIRALFEGDSSPEAGLARANEQTKMLETVSKSVHELMKQMADGANDLQNYLADAAKEMAKLSLPAADAAKSIADIALQQQLANIDKEKQERIKAAEAAAQPAIEAARKAAAALQTGDSTDPNAIKLTGWEEFSTSNGDAKAAHLERAQNAEVARNAEMQANKAKLAAIAQAEAEADKKAEVAKDLAAKHAEVSDAEAGQKRTEQARKDGQEVADAQAETNARVLETQAKQAEAEAQALQQQLEKKLEAMRQDKSIDAKQKDAADAAAMEAQIQQKSDDAAKARHQAQLIELRAALDKRLDEIKKEAEAEEKARGLYDDKGIEENAAREQAKVKAAKDAEAAQEAAAAQQDQLSQQEAAMKRQQEQAEATKDLQQQAKSINEDSLTPLGKYAEQVERINALKKLGLLSDQQAIAAIAKQNQELGSHSGGKAEKPEAEIRRFDFNLGKQSPVVDPIKQMVEQQKNANQTLKLSQQYLNYWYSNGIKTDTTTASI